MHEKLGALGLVTSKSLVQLRASLWVTVLRGNIEDKQFYLKASPCFCDEGARTCIMSESAPVLVCKPLVADRERGAFISSDYGENPEGHVYIGVVTAHERSGQARKGECGEG